MNKTIIFGNSGSGKSTLAKHMAAKNKLAHLDLDTVAWQATKPPVRNPLAESKQALALFLANNNDWVIEGCYADLLQWVAAHANQVVFMNLSVSLCQKNARNRAWEPHKYESKAAQDANLPMLLDWIAAYTNRTDEFSLQAHNNLYNQFTGVKQQITENPTTDGEIRT